MDRQFSRYNVFNDHTHLLLCCTLRSSRIGTSCVIEGKTPAIRDSTEAYWAYPISDGWIDRKVAANWEMIPTLLRHFL